MAEIIKLEPKQINLGYGYKQTGTYVCHNCEYEWLAPYPSKFKACPNCSMEGSVVLRDGSVKNTLPTRK